MNGELFKESSINLIKKHIELITTTSIGIMAIDVSITLYYKPTTLELIYNILMGLLILFFVILIILHLNYKNKINEQIKKEQEKKERNEAYNKLAEMYGKLMDEY